MPGVGAFHDPTGSGFKWLAVFTENPFTTELGQQVTGYGSIVASIEKHGDLRWLGRIRSGRAFLVWAVAVVKHVVLPALLHNQGDASAVGEQGAFGASFAAVYRGFSVDFTAAGYLDDAAIHGEIL